MLWRGCLASYCQIFWFYDNLDLPSDGNFYPCFLGDLLGLMREHSEPLPENSIRMIILQILQGLAYMHR
jgi:serine/threonine protein kinase